MELMLVEMDHSIRKKGEKIMTEQKLLKEINSIKERISHIERTLCQYTNAMFKNSLDNDAVSENAIVDLEIGLEELKQKVGDLNE